MMGEERSFQVSGTLLDIKLFQLAMESEFFSDSKMAIISTRGMGSLAKRRKELGSGGPWNR